MYPSRIFSYFHLSIIFVFSSLVNEVNAKRTRQDVGFSGLFLGNTNEQITPIELSTNSNNQTISNIPSYVEGVFFISSLYSTSVENTKTGETQRIRAFLDAFHKMVKIEVSSDQKVSLSMRVINSPFYEKSKELGRIAPQILFAETEPSRPCVPWMKILNICGVSNLMANLNNMYAASYSIRDTDGVSKRVTLTTDTANVLDIDLESLETIGIREWEDSIAQDNPSMMLGNTHVGIQEGDVSNGSHTKWRSELAVDDQNHYGIIYGNRLMDVAMHPFDVSKQKVDMAFYRINPQTPDKREILLSFEVGSSSAVHQFPITPSHAGVAIQPSSTDLLKMVKGEGLLNSMVEISDSTIFYVWNIDEASSSEDLLKFEIDEKIFYIHVVNSFITENDNGEQEMVIYIIKSSKMQFSEDNPAIMIDKARNENMSDRNELYKEFPTEVAKVSLNLENDDASIEVLNTPNGTNDYTTIDFAKVNPDFMGLSNCIYYAVEWGHNGFDYGSMALRKHNLCTNEISHYNFTGDDTPYFPSEPVIIPDPNCTASCPPRTKKTENIFSTRDQQQAEEKCRDLCEDSVTILTLISTGEMGSSGNEVDDILTKTSFVIIDGRDMTTIAVYDFPPHLTTSFNVHSQWFNSRP